MQSVARWLRVHSNMATVESCFAESVLIIMAGQSLARTATPKNLNTLWITEVSFFFFK